MSLDSLWLQVQNEMPDAGETLLYKTADGHLLPITKPQLMQLIQNLQAGQTITVGGFNIFSPDGQTLQITATSQPQQQPTKQPQQFAKSAQRNQISFGSALQGLYNLEDRRHW